MSDIYQLTEIVRSSVSFGESPGHEQFRVLFAEALLRLATIYLSEFQVVPPHFEVALVREVIGGETCAYVVIYGRTRDLK